VLSLVMNPGLSDEEAFMLAPGSVTIGRTRDNQVVCTHKSLSRRHAQLDYDGQRVRVADLKSKNGVYHHGKRVAACEVLEGESFRCGDVTFLVEGATARRPKSGETAHTLPSPLVLDGATSKGLPRPPPAVLVVDEERFKDKVEVLVRASDLLVSELPVDHVLDQLVLLAVTVLDVDRVALLLLDDQTLALRPRVLKTFAGAAPRPYSRRVVDAVVDQGSAAAFPDVSQDRTLPGDAAEDAAIRAAMAAPVNPGSGTIGVLYADSVSRVGVFGPDDLALFRALANLSAVALDRGAQERSSPRTTRTP
jgi:adenylate cyclase